MGEQGKSNKVLLLLTLLILGMGLSLEIFIFARVGWYGSVNIVFVIPGILLLLIYLAIPKMPHLKWLFSFICIPLAIISLVCLGVIFIILPIMSVFPGAVTNPSKYEKVLESYGYPESELCAHFPPRIPENAKEVKFYYSPKIMQGDSSMQLRYVAPDDELSNLLQKYLPVARHIQNGNTGAFKFLETGKGLPTTEFRNKNNTKFEDLPEDFQVIVLYAKAYPNRSKAEKDQTIGEIWNNGDSCGIAISTKRHEIIYWAYYW